MRSHFFPLYVIFSAVSSIVYMGRVRKSVVGELEGRVDYLVFWKRNGERFVSVRPRHYNASKSEAAKTGRTNFAASVALAKAVNAVPVLKEIWTDAKVSGTDSYHRIIKFNSKLVQKGALTVTNKITPAGLPLYILSAEINYSSLQLTFSFAPNNNIKFPVTAYIFFYFKENRNTLFNISEEIKIKSQDDFYTFIINLDSIIKKELKENSNPVIYIALTGSVSYERKIYWSSTASYQF
jgi:hypothetical protein